MVGVQAGDPYHAFIESSFTVFLLDDDTEDRDGDGFTDGQEAEAGTDPDSNTSMPGIDYGLVAWYPFDGNASDMSGNGNHGTVYGATLGTDRHGQENRAYNFDGVDDFIEVVDSTDFDFQDKDFSVLAWVKKFSQVNSNTGVIMSQWNTGASPSSNEWFFTTTTSGQIGQANFSVEIGNTLHKSVDPTYFNIGQWAQITGVRKGTDLYLYFNGNEVSKEGNVTGSVNETGRNLVFGKYRDLNPFFAHISIDDAKIYDRALSEDEVRLIYDLEGALPNGAVTYAKLAPALQDLVDGNGSIFASLPAGSVIAVDANQTAPLGYTRFEVLTDPAKDLYFKEGNASEEAVGTLLGLRMVP